MERNEPDTNVIVDAGPLIHLDELGSIGLLRDIKKVVIPASVWEDRQGFKSLPI